jgi:hypothetical protein
MMLEAAEEDWKIARRAVLFLRTVLNPVSGSYLDDHFHKANSRTEQYAPGVPRGRLKQSCGVQKTAEAPDQEAAECYIIGLASYCSISHPTYDTVTGHWQ